MRKKAIDKACRAIAHAGNEPQVKAAAREIEQLRRADADRLYERLGRVTGQRHDPCCRDVFAAAIAQAKNPNLPEEQRDWWYWSRLRK
jgi:hypothetical protein